MNFPPVDDLVGKIEATKSVTSGYQEITGLNTG